MNDPIKEDANIIEDIVVQTQKVLDAIKHPDTSRQTGESREVIYNKVEQKMNRDSFALPSRRKRFVHYISIASVIALLIVSVGTSTYFYGYHSATHKMARTNMEVKVPLGTMSHIILPDGTKVTLNGGSKLIYPVAFDGERSVTLSGEGFFDVAKDEKNPFFVHSQNLSVKVLGTRFGFKAYDEDKQTVLTLQSGLVSAFPYGSEKGNGIHLKPNQQIIVDNETKEFWRRDVIADEYLTWKDGILTFRNQAIEDIAVILERHFGTKISVLSDNLRHEQYTAQFKHGEGLDEILSKLSFKRAWNFKKANGRIEIISSK